MSPPRLSVPAAVEAVRTVRRAANSAAEEATTRLAGLLASIPDRRLDHLMRTPARRPVVEALFLLMPLYLNRTRARGLNLAVRWRVTEEAPGTAGDAAAEVFDLVIADRRGRVLRGAAGPPPLVTITIGSADLVRLAIGRLNPMQAYFDGRLKLSGDVMQASRLVSLFRIPSRRSRPDG